MLFKKILAEQSRKPSGYFGRIVGRMMARANQEANLWVLSLLDYQPTDSILELGFGPGQMIKSLSEKVPQGLVAGVDISEAMLQQASDLNRKALETGRVELKLAQATELPYEDSHFDTVFAINLVYVLPDLGSVISEVKRVLKSGGRAAIYMAPLELMRKLFGEQSPDTFTFYSPEAVIQALVDAGFRHSDVKTEPMNGGKGRCVIVEK
jgi:ubiquinone/menaquinone biosynthesis C-methylase UbiE